MDDAIVFLGGLGIGLGAAWLYRFVAGLDVPLGSNPVSSEERKALEDLSDAESEKEDLKKRLKHAEQERVRAERDRDQIKAESKQDRLTLWRIRRALDGGGPVPEPELVGDEARAG